MTAFFELSSLTTPRNHNPRFACNLHHKDFQPWRMLFNAERPIFIAWDLFGFVVLFCSINMTFDENIHTPW